MHDVRVGCSMDALSHSQQDPDCFRRARRALDDFPPGRCGPAPDSRSGVVSTPLFSPDGRWIAYTFRRDGLRDVFVIHAEGGKPRRLAYEASSFAEAATTVAWTPDSKRIVFLSHRSSPVTKLIRAFSVPVGGGSAELLPLDRAGLMSFAPGGQTIAYNAFPQSRIL